MKTLTEQLDILWTTGQRMVNKQTFIDEIKRMVKERDEMLLRGMDVIIKMDENISANTPKKELLDLLKHMMERDRE